MTAQPVKLSRRDFLRWVAISAGAMALYSCGVRPEGTTPAGPTINMTLKTAGWQ